MTSKSPHPTTNMRSLLTICLLLTEKSFGANAFGRTSFVSCHRRRANFWSTTSSKSFQRLLVIQQYRNETIGKADDGDADYGGTDRPEIVNPDYMETRDLRTVAGENEQTDYVGAGTFGDIMSDPADEKDWNSVPESSVEVKSGLVMSAGGSLQSQFGHKISSLSPLDRIALTANGNLQRIFSSYYDAPVHVHVDKCDQILSSGSVWNRRVNLSVFGQTFCTAESEVTVHSSECRTLIKSGEVGIGQLFRYLDKLPKFTIIDAGRSSNGGLWRYYTLQCNELTCNIREEFSANAWELRPRGLDHFDDHDNTF